MKVSLLPDVTINKLTDVKAQPLIGRNIRVLLLDLDNTIAAYHAQYPDEGIISWSADMKSAGITLFIVSNSRRESRVKRFAETLDIGYVHRARKPFARVMRSVLKGLNAAPGSAAMCGDQIFTDILGGSASGALTILVEPVKLEHFFHKVRYVIELPFRHATAGRHL